MTRREFLRLLGSASVAGPALIGQSACAPTLTRTDTSTGLSLCYVAGDVTPDGAMVWLRAEPNSQVFLHYSKESSLGDFSSIGPFPVDGDADCTALIKLEKLEPATTYYYRAAVAGSRGGAAHRARPRRACPVRARARARRRVVAELRASGGGADGSERAARRENNDEAKDVRGRGGSRPSPPGGVLPEFTAYSPP